MKANYSISVFGCILPLIGLLLCSCDRTPLGPAPLEIGQTEAEVRKILGTPDGFITSSNQTLLLYRGGTLVFEDGKLTAPEGEGLEKIQDASKNSKK